MLACVTLDIHILILDFKKRVLNWRGEHEIYIPFLGWSSKAMVGLGKCCGNHQLSGSLRGGQRLPLELATATFLRITSYQGQRLLKGSSYTQASSHLWMVIKAQARSHSGLSQCNRPLPGHSVNQSSSRCFFTWPLRGPSPSHPSRPPHTLRRFAYSSWEIFLNLLNQISHL